MAGAAAAGTTVYTSVIGVMAVVIVLGFLAWSFLFG
jgi:hypothetical protein